MRTSPIDRVLAVQASLTHRDLTLLSWLADHGVLTTPQIVEALFGSVSFAQRRLLRLLELGVVARFRPQKPDGGSFPYHWVLDQAGAEVVAAQRGQPIPRPGVARARRLHLTARANLNHLLGANGFFTALAAHQRTHPGTELVELWPASRYTEPHSLYEMGDDLDMSLRLGAQIRPDGSGVWADRDRAVWFLLEHDTGTEPLGTLISKIVRYWALIRAKRRPFAVVFDLGTARREHNLRTRLADEYGLLDLPVATSSRDLRAATGLCPAGPVWWALAHQDRLRLVDLHDLAVAAQGPPNQAREGGGGR